MNIITNHKLANVDVVNLDEIKDKYIVCQITKINGNLRLIFASSFAEEPDAINYARMINGIIVENIINPTIDNCI